MEEVEFIRDVGYVWMKVRGGRGKEVPVIKKFKNITVPRQYLNSTLVYEAT